MLMEGAVVGGKGFGTTAPAGPPRDVSILGEDRERVGQRERQIQREREREGGREGGREKERPPS